MESNYKTFCVSLCDLFDRDWEKYSDRMTIGYEFLNHIPREAWKPMVQMAVDKWESWPRNWVKSIKELYQLWQGESKFRREITNCDYCNSNGFFDGIKYIEVKPEMDVSYSYCWRCAGCRNWFGILGNKVPIAFPLEMKSQGFEIKVFPKPIPEDSKYFDLKQLLEIVGNRTNPKVNRPAIQKFSDEPPF